MRYTPHKHQILPMHFYQSIRFFVSGIIAPISRREDDARREFILNIILLSSIILSAISTVSVFLNSFDRTPEEYGGIPIIVIVTILLIFTTLLWLSKKGFAKVASVILLFLYFVPTTYTILHWGIHIEAAVLSYVLIIIMAGILMSTRFAILTTVFISGTITYITYLHTHGIVTADTSWMNDPTKLNDAVAFSVLLGVITVVTWLANRETEKSLKRARRSEALLKKERNSLEARIEERTKELKQTQIKQVEQLHKFAEFGRMTSGFFHDLVNPLTAVSLHMEHIKQGDLKDVEEIEEHITHATQALGRLEKFVEAIRKQLQHVSDHTTFSLTEELLQAVDILGYKARKSSVTIEVDTAQEVSMWGDPLKFHQIALNLLSNAIDAYENKVTREEKIILVSLTQTGNAAIFSVQDFGGGIPENVLPRIFDALFTTKSQSKGLGLGLTTVKHIVEKELHGTITVLSTQNEGSLFTVTFPLTSKVEV